MSRVPQPSPGRCGLAFVVFVVTVVEEPDDVLLNFRRNSDNNIRIPDNWIAKHGREDTAVKLPDGGYLGMLSAFHEVHCIVSHLIVRCTFSPAMQIKRAGFGFWVIRKHVDLC